MRWFVLAPVMVLATALVGSTAPLSQSVEKPAADPMATVWCHDVDRAIVSRKRAWKCKGDIVDDAEAKDIQHRRLRRLRQGFDKPKPLFKGTRLRGTGSGFFVSTSGHVLTNHHVVDDCKGISVTPADGRAMIARLVARDTGDDLALLQTPGYPSLAAPFRDPPAFGPDEEVFVVGYPLHGKVTIKPILEEGTLYRGNERPRAQRFAMNIDIRRGNSGGPVLDRTGRVVGVVVAKINTPHVFATTGRVLQDVGVAIRPTVALDFLRAQGVEALMVNGGTRLTEEAMLEHAHSFVGQIGCWR